MATYKEHRFAGFGLAAAIGLGICANAHATTIVAIWTPDKIVIAGDSLLLMNWTGANGLPQQRTSKECKIRKFGSNYVSAAGNYHIQTAGFDVWASAAHACGASIGVDQCAERFRGELRTKLAPVVGVHDVYLSVLVAGLQNGEPVLHHMTVIGAPDGHLSIQSESFRRGRQKWGRVILGERDAIDQFERGAASTMTDSLQEALALVRVEARALPREVAAPFSTLVIEPGGEHWVNGGCCPASCPK